MVEQVLRTKHNRAGTAPNPRQQGEPPGPCLPLCMEDSHWKEPGWSLREPQDERTTALTGEPAPHWPLPSSGTKLPQQAGHRGRGLLLASSLRQAASSQLVVDDKGGEPNRATRGTHEVDLYNLPFPCLLVLATVLKQPDGDSKAREGEPSASAWAQHFPTQDTVHVFVS